MHKLFSIKQASEILACHPNTIRNMIQRGELTAYKVRRVVRVDLDSFRRHEVGKDGGSHELHD